MDVQECMIVDLDKRGDKRMFITEQVVSIRENINGFWIVRFSLSERVFNYNRARLLYLTHPEIIDLGKKGVYIKNKHIDDVAKLLRFTDGLHTFYWVNYINGYQESLEGGDVYITRTPIDKNGGSTWDYLRKLADESELVTDDDSILSKQYDLVDVMRDNVPLAQYLGDHKKLLTYSMPELMYYPFGCNASQKAAVEAALTHQVSIIQGPPGTGKTQTILNIIANLLMANKTVLVVSNNNSAIENVAEKLNKEHLGFIAAKLGSVKNKESFIAKQRDYPDMRSWIINDSTSIEKLAQDSLFTVSQYFAGQLRQAQLTREYDALLKESRYNDMLETNKVEIAWLNSKPSNKLMRLLSEYKIIADANNSPRFWFRLKWSFTLGLKINSFLSNSSSTIIASLESAYYSSRTTEIEQELESITSAFQLVDIKQCEKNLQSSSIQILKSKMAKRYGFGKRIRFSIKDIKPKTEQFLKEYPVILSTTYSAKSCISKNMVFDYVIMDEASQVDIKTGALALSCATNAVIVGDDKQLPNVVSREEALALNAIRSTFGVDDRYNAITHSFLQSCTEIFKDVPVTFLREHYRCHPKIIEFCNKRFYNGELVSMTTDNGEDNVLQVIRTVKGNHARGHLNQREIDVISQEVILDYADMDSVGIITPYRTQAEEINKMLEQNIASTVHKYQGRECDTIILSTVDDTPTEFSDDANLLNVAISRAKKHLCIVTNGNETPQNSNLAQLIAYVRYNNFDITESKLHSVFDLLYKQYTTERLAYISAHKRVSDYLSENLVYDVLIKAITEMGLINIDVLCHYPLSKLIADWSMLDNKERVFAESPLAHVDFLIYNSLTKQPLQTIEVDGWHFHNGNDIQKARDALKDHILTHFGLCPHRISTTEIVNAETIKQVISIEN